MGNKKIKEEMEDKEKAAEEIIEETPATEEQSSEEAKEEAAEATETEAAETSEEVAEEAKDSEEAGETKEEEAAETPADEANEAEESAEAEAETEEAATTEEESESPEDESGVPEPVEGQPEEAPAKKQKKSRAKKEKKEKKPFNPKNMRFSFSEGFDKLQASIPALVITYISAFIVMMLVACAIFFANIKGAEKVLVPNVVGKKWDEAFIEMQIKELYPKINLRYSNVPGDEGLVLEQDPQPGAIVKGYSRVNLVISRGVVIDAVGSYVGKNISEVQMSLQTLFAGQTKPLIVLGTPKYIPDASEAGTILEQDPPEGSKISEPVTVQLVVSRGPNYENTRRPYVIGQSINDLLQTIARTKIVFDITSHTATEQEKPGTVVSQQTIEDEYVPNYTRVTVEMAMPADSNDDNAYGIFQEKLPDYPYPVPMKLEAYPAEGNSYTIVSFNHPGGNLTIPYEVPRGTTLVLSVADKVESRKLIE